MIIQKGIKIIHLTNGLQRQNLLTFNESVLSTNISILQNLNQRDLITLKNQKAQYRREGMGL